MAVDANWYSCHIGIISRSQVRTAIGAAAYITGTKLVDREREASPNYEPSDYTRKGGVEQWFITARDTAPEWAFDMDTLVNEAQARDTRRNSCTARTGRFSLPYEADAEGRERITREVAGFLTERYGVAVIASIHAPDRHGDDRNWHAHLWFTTRQVQENGFGAKTRVLDDKKTGPQEIVRIREAVANSINDYLGDAGSDEQVDHRSYEDRGMDRIPMIHMGEAASALERKGIRTERGDINRAIQESNRRLEERMQEITVLQAELARELEKELSDPEQEKAPSLAWEASLDTEGTPPLPLERDKELDSAMSWEEEKARAQHLANFDMTTIRSAQMDYDPNGSFAFLAAQGRAPSLSPPQTLETDGETISPGWEEQKQQEQDPLTSPLVREMERQITTYGEVREYGLGMNSFDRTIARFEDFYYGAVETVRDTWDKYVTSRFRDRDNDPDRDVGPER